MLRGLSVSISLLTEEVRNFRQAVERVSKKSKIGIKELQKALQECERNRKREKEEWKVNWREIEERISQLKERKRRGNELNLQQKLRKMEE